VFASCAEWIRKHIHFERLGAFGNLAWPQVDDVAGPDRWHARAGPLPRVVETKRWSANQPALRCISRATVLRDARANSRRSIAEAIGKPELHSARHARWFVERNAGAHRGTPRVDCCDLEAYGDGVIALTASAATGALLSAAIEHSDNRAEPIEAYGLTRRLLELCPGRLYLHPMPSPVTPTESSSMRSLSRNAWRCRRSRLAPCAFATPDDALAHKVLGASRPRRNRRRSRHQTQQPVPRGEHPELRLKALAVRLLATETRDQAIAGDRRVQLRRSDGTRRRW
jgi:hypothetical protein